MKTLIRLLPLWLVCLVALAACGYHNPLVYTGPSRSIYITEWKNRTNQLELNINIYQSLVRWFQKSGKITVTKEKDGADLILAGEVISIFLPSRTYNVSGLAVESKLHLRVRYILKDLKTGKVLIEAPEQLFTQDCMVSSNPIETETNQQEAMKKAIEDMSQKIYQRSISEFSKEQKK